MSNKNTPMQPARISERLIHDPGAGDMETVAFAHRRNRRRAANKLAAKSRKANRR